MYSIIYLPNGETADTLSAAERKINQFPWIYKPFPGKVLRKIFDPTGNLIETREYSYQFNEKKSKYTITTNHYQIV
ncbi:MAG: hypothetical protein MJZ96_01035 [Paludibacteraceae bacterium]|nr:hypothetical protein [Paludibacteraceae bacterium]